RTPEEITDHWLMRVIHRPDAAIRSVTPIGTGQMSQSHRVAFVDHTGEASVVVKLASADPTSRATGVSMGAYSREISFYQQLSARIPGPLPACHLAEYDAGDGWFTLVLEDIA